MCGLLCNVVFLAVLVGIGFLLLRCPLGSGFSVPGSLAVRLFFPDCCFFFPQVFLVPTGVLLFPASRHFVFPRLVFFAPKKGFWIPTNVLCSRNGVFPSRPEKVHISDGILRSPLVFFGSQLK